MIAFLTFNVVLARQDLELIEIIVQRPKLLGANCLVEYHWNDIQTISSMKCLQPLVIDSIQFCTNNILGIHQINFNDCLYLPKENILNKNKKKIKI